MAPSNLVLPIGQNRAQIQTSTNGRGQLGSSGIFLHSDLPSFSQARIRLLLNSATSALCRFYGGIILNALKKNVLEGGLEPPRVLPH